MRFPLRLRAEILRSTISSFFLKRETGFFRLAMLSRSSSVDDRSDDSDTQPEWNSPQECVRLADAVRARIIWIEGEEPLYHPEIGRVARALVQSGRQVFLHTNGLQLRNRIHEFQPDNRLFFTVEFAEAEGTHDRIAAQNGTFALAMEGIRVAKLSGFLVCAHVTVNETTELAEIGSLFQDLKAKDVDGFVVSSRGALAKCAETESLAAKLKSARAMIPNRWWQRLSLALEASYGDAIPVAEPVEIKRGEPGSFEEAV